MSLFHIKNKKIARNANTFKKNVSGNTNESKKIQKHQKFNLKHQKHIFGEAAQKRMLLSNSRKSMQKTLHTNINSSNSDLYKP